MMERPSIDAADAVEQAGATIGQYLHQAINEIDRALGAGYAKKNPELIAACVSAQTLDFNSVALTSALYAISDAIIDTIIERP
jgi:hypothetical protein